MPFAPLMSLPYPDEWSNPYWAAFAVHANWMDGWFQALRENADLNIIQKGGSWALAAGSLSWDVNIVIVSSTDGGDLTIAAGVLAIPADGVVYTTLPVRPLTGSQVGTLSYAATLPVGVGYYVLGVVYGGTWYPRSELSLASVFSYGIYVDAANGSDITGDGTVQYPYQTLQVAYASVTTTNLAEFITPVQFILRPGTYSGMGANLPNRQYINVTGSRYRLTAQQYVALDGAIPVTLANYPRYVLFSTDTPLESYFGTGASYFHVRRVNTGVGGAPPSQSVIVLQDLMLTTGKILINPSGSANPNENTGSWQVFMKNCYQQVLSNFCLFGSYEAPSNDLNRLDFFSHNSIVGVGSGATVLRLRGVVGLGDIVGTNLKINVDYGLDDSDLAYTGSIGGSPFAYVGIQASEINAGANTAFGWGGVTPAAPSYIKGDSNCLKRLVDEGFTFTNFTGSNEVRGWALHSDNLEYQQDWPSDSTLIVPRGEDDVQSGLNLITTYNRAKLLTPGGLALSAMNRAVVIVPPGTYDLGLVSVTGGLVVDTDYVDLFGLVDSSPRRLPLATSGVDPVVPDAYIIGATDSGPLIEHSALDVRLFNLGIDSSNGGFIRHCIAIRSSNADSHYSNLYIDADTSAAVEGISLGAPITVSGHWDNIRTPKSLFPGTFSGTAENCRAGDYSFGGHSTSGFDGVCTGTLYNCIAGVRSFGASQWTPGTFNGVAVDCVAGNYSFGWSDDDAGTCSGTLTRCTAGDCSFGYSVDADGLNTATMEGCVATDKSYGSSDGATGTSGVSSGSYLRCIAGGYSFGYSYDGVALCSGVYTDCTSTGFSFGTTGAIGGGDFGEDATFSGSAEGCTSGTVAGCMSFGASTNTVDSAVVVTVSGVFKRCTAIGDYAFGVGFAGSVDVTNSSEFDDCVAEDRSFGYSLSNNADCDGTFRRCRSGNYSFGVTGDNTATYYGYFSGIAYDCISGDNSFAVCFNAGIQARLTGQLYRCISGGESFGWEGGGADGDCSGVYMEDCTAGDGSITYGTGVTSNSTFVRCRMIQRALDKYIRVGTNTRFIDCQFSADNIVLYITDDVIPVHIYNCSLEAALGVAPTISGDADYSICLAHSRLNTPLDNTPGTTITNIIVDGYNVIDPLIEGF